MQKISYLKGQYFDENLVYLKPSIEFEKSWNKRYELVNKNDKIKENKGWGIIFVLEMRFPVNFC